MRWLAYVLINTAAAARRHHAWARPDLAAAPSCPRHELFDLLRELFSTIELRVFLSSGPDGDEILATLPQSSCLTQLVFETVEQLDQRGLVTAALFHRLGHERPHQGREISRVARAWNIDVPAGMTRAAT